MWQDKVATAVQMGQVGLAAATAARHLSRCEQALERSQAEDKDREKEIEREGSNVETEQMDETHTLEFQLGKLNVLSCEMPFDLSKSRLHCEKSRWGRRRGNREK